MGGTQGGKPMTQRDPNRGPTEPGEGFSSGMSEEWNRDQVGQVADREQGGSTGNRRRTNTPEESPLQDDENGLGTTQPPGESAPPGAEPSQPREAPRSATGPR
jgi:hypothetical protein